MTIFLILIIISRLNIILCNSVQVEQGISETRVANYRGDKKVNPGKTLERKNIEGGGNRSLIPRPLQRLYFPSILKRVKLFDTIQSSKLFRVSHENLGINRINQSL